MTLHDRMLGRANTVYFLFARLSVVEVEHMDSDRTYGTDSGYFRASNSWPAGNTFAE